ncbi:MAG TPA: histidine kinase [Streptosporangiaceae bacterium]
MSLFWRVFVTNAALLVAAAVVLGLSPVTVSWPIAITEAVVLGLGLTAMLAANAVLLRVAFAPLRALATRMTEVDLIDHPQPLAAAGRSEIATLVGAFNDMLARLETERRDSARRALAAQEDERRRVACELHDEVGQSMTAVLMLLERLHDGVVASRRAELRDAQETVRASLEEVRRIAQELRPELLEHLGLVSALTALSRGFTQRTGITVDYQFGPDLPSLDSDAELAIFRIVQESLTNVARHAHARAVQLSIQHTPQKVRIQVEDDGRGFAGPIPGSAGIRGMRERAILIGGHLTIGTASTGGAQVSLDIPRTRPIR